MKDYQYLQQKYVVNTYVNRMLTLVGGEGMYLHSDTREQYLDLMSNYGVNICGYNNPEITSALQMQVSRLITLHGSFASDQRARAAEMLVKRAGGGVSHVFLSNSGAEAVEAALKFAVLATGRDEFIACGSAYHGKTLGALAATSGDKYRKPFESLMPRVKFIAFNDISQLDAAITPRTAAFIVEPVQGEGGIHMPSAQYLSQARAICTERGVLLIIDEIQTGMGRTGTFLASHPSQISYDIVCMGKGMAGGLPVGATLVSPAVHAAIPRQMHTSTFGGNPLSCAGILAALEWLDDEMLLHVKKVGMYCVEQIRSLNHPLVREVRGEGLMIGIELTGRRNEVIKFLQQNHILVIPSGETVIRLLPPFIIEKHHVDEFVKVFEKFK